MLVATYLLTYTPTYVPYLSYLLTNLGIRQDVHTPSLH